MTSSDDKTPKMPKTGDADNAFDKFSRIAESLKREAGLGDEAKPEDMTAEEYLLATLEEILFQVQKQDGLHVENSKSLPVMAKALTEMAEAQPQILARLAAIESHQAPPNIFKRAALGTVKGITLAAIIAASAYVGSANDITDAPKDLTNWAEKHDLLQHFER